MPCTRARRTCRTTRSKQAARSKEHAEFSPSACCVLHAALSSRASLGVSMDTTLLEQYLAEDSRRGPTPDGAFTGAAGGAPCGDLVRLSIVLEDGMVDVVTFDADGCAAATAAAAAVAESAEGESVLTAAAIGADEVAGALGGLSPQGRHAADLAADALHRALSAAASSGERLAEAPAGGERVLVAMSGGVDSAVAALLERERGADVVAVTLKLWADRYNDGANSCCSPEAVTGELMRLISEPVACCGRYRLRSCLVDDLSLRTAEFISAVKTVLFSRSTKRLVNYYGAIERRARYMAQSLSMTSMSSSAPVTVMFTRLEQTRGASNGRNERVAALSPSCSPAIPFSRPLSITSLTC